MLRENISVQCTSFDFLNDVAGKHLQQLMHLQHGPCLPPTEYRAAERCRNANTHLLNKHINGILFLFQDNWSLLIWPDRRLNLRLFATEPGPLCQKVNGIKVTNYSYLVAMIGQNAGYKQFSFLASQLNLPLNLLS